MSVIGHQKQWTLLKQAVKNGKVPQVLIFVGEDGLGKKKIAIQFLQLLHCQEKKEEGRPCGRCQACALIEQQQHPDVIFIAKENKIISIDQIRDLNAKLSLRPLISVRQSILVDNAHCLNIEAQNCFLKTLEEPQGEVNFILLTSALELLLSTIRSRSEIIKFFPVGEQEMKKGLAVIFPQHNLDEVVAFSDGKPGWALEFLKGATSPASPDFRGLNKIAKIFTISAAERIVLVDKFLDEENSVQPAQFVENILRYLRGDLLQKLGVAGSFSSYCFVQTGHSFFKTKEMIKEVEKVKFLLATSNINPKLALENLMLKF